LEPGASENDIKAAHHRLIASLHPDRGGTNYLAAKVNQARQVLLGR
jgi:curved DNA-binding protein CbpA